MAEIDELLLEREWRKCHVANWDTATVEEKAQAFEHFCRNYYFIRHPKGGKRLFDLFPAQSSIIRTWLGSRYSVALKARQIGFSTLIAAYAFWLAYFYDDRGIIMVSKTERHSAKLLQLSKYGYKFLPEWMKLRGPHVDQTTQSKFSFYNESTIESLPSASEPGRGDTAFLAIIDEIGFLPNSEEAFAALEPVAEVGGSLIALGTANGEGNLLHKLWLGSQGLGSQYAQFTGIFFPWSAAANRDDAWYLAKAAVTPEWQMAQEYPSNPEEAFLKSGRPVMSLDAIRENPTRPPSARGYLRQLPGKDLEFVEDGGALRVWEPPEVGQVYAIGADVAEGLDYGDFSCSHVINARSNEVVAVWHGHVEPDVFGEDVLAKLGVWYNNALVGVEKNGPGGTTLKALQRADYRNLYYQRRLGQKFEKATLNLGWSTNKASKPLAVLELDMALRGGAWTPTWDEELGDYVVDENEPARGPNALTVFDEETLAELKTFTRDERGRMSGSPFDDRTMSLAIANQMLKDVWLPEYKVDAKPPPGTIGYMLALAEQKGPNAVRPPRGSFNVRAGGVPLGLRR